MPLYANAARRQRCAVRVTLTVLIVAAFAGCAKEQPEDAEPRSLKDSWANGTRVTYATPPVQPVRTAYATQPRAVAPKPKVRPATHKATPSPKSQVMAAPTPPARPDPPTPPRAAPQPSTPTPPPQAPAPTAPPAKPDLGLSAPSNELPKPLSEKDLAGDTTRCGVGTDCLAVLRAMIADPQQSWMARTPTLADFTNGTRLFAYRALRTTLECGKLRFASAELDWAVDTFKAAVEGVDAGHRARVAALAEAVRAEIQGEIKRRC